MLTQFDPNNILSNQWVRLEPLQPMHADALWKIGQQAADWQYLPRGCFTSQDDLHAWIDEALLAQTKGEQQAFVIFDQQTGQCCGSTRYLNIRAAHFGVEIGWTWLAQSAQRTAINTATKLCLFEYAFEQWQMRRVELKTDLRNLRSQRAIERLGAVREGVWRKHMCVQQGYMRDTVFYSVIDDEWPMIKQRLQAFLQR